MIAAATMNTDIFEEMTALCDRLDAVPPTDALSHAMAVEASWIRGFARTLLENSGQADWPGATADHESSLATLRERWGTALEAKADYRRVMAISDQLVAEGHTRKLRPEGYLGALVAIRELFGFLRTEFGFHVVSEHIDRAEYRSDKVSVELSLPNAGDSYCTVARLGDPGHGFPIEDIAFAAGQEPLVVPDRLHTDGDAWTWFQQVAELIRRHGGAALRGEAGAFERLAVASEERDRLYSEAMERLAAEWEKNEDPG